MGKMYYYSDVKNTTVSDRPWVYIYRHEYLRGPLTSILNFEVWLKYTYDINVYFNLLSRSRLSDTRFVCNGLYFIGSFV